MSPSRNSGSTAFARQALQGLKKRYEAAHGEYRALSVSCERSVTRWVWTTAPRYNLDPLFFFDPQMRIGKLVSSPPSDPRGYAAYGFSSENRIVTERQYTADLEGLYYRGFYREEGDRIMGYYFDYDPPAECVNCSQLIFEGRSPAFFQRWAQRGSTSYTYITLDRRIRSFTELFQEDDGPQQKVSGELRYLDDGRVEVWTKGPSATRAERTLCGAPPAENPFLR